MADDVEFWTGLWNKDGVFCFADECNYRLYWEGDLSTFTGADFLQNLETKVDELCLFIKKDNDEVEAKKCDVDEFPAVCECDQGTQLSWSLGTRTMLEMALHTSDI